MQTQQLDLFAVCDAAPTVIVGAPGPQEPVTDRLGSPAPHPKEIDSPPAVASAPEDPLAHVRQANRLSVQAALSAFPLKKLQAGVHRDLEPGWLLPFVIQYDDAFWGRWSYWLDLMVAVMRPRQADDPAAYLLWLMTMGPGADADRIAAIDPLNPPPIPPIGFSDSPHAQTRKMLEQCLNAIPSHHEWRTWGGSEYFDYFLDWLLFGLGHLTADQRAQFKASEPVAQPREPHGCDGASDRLYQLFQSGPLQLWPADYFGELLAEVGFGKAAGFYPTPLCVCKLMADMLGKAQEISPWQSVCDPCVGTGRMLMVYSNHSLRLYGMDIGPTMVKATLVNLALYAPWGFRPLDAGPMIHPAGRPEARDYHASIFRGDSLSEPLIQSARETAAA